VKKFLFVFIALATALALTPAALADTLTWGFTFTPVGNDGFSGSGTITGTLDTSISPDAYVITAITGTYSDTNPGGVSGTITGLVPGIWNDGNGTFYPIGICDLYGSCTGNGNEFSWPITNVFFPAGDALSCSGGPTGGQLDYCGLLFAVNYNTFVNVSGNGAGQEYWVNDFDATAYNLDPNAALSYGPDPDPNNALIPQYGGYVSFSASLEPSSSIPEPSSLLLLGTGLVSLAGMLRRKLAR
jgi:hypothetical protein